MKKIILLSTCIMMSMNAFAQMTYDRQETYKLVESLEEDDFLTKIDLNKGEFQIMGFFWQSIKLDSKRNTIKLFSCYYSYKKGRSEMMSITVVDDRSGEELGEYSVWSGAKVK